MCRMLPSRKMARSAVPPPKSTMATPSLTFLRAQHRFAGGQRLQDDVDHVEAPPDSRSDDIPGPRSPPRDDMHVDLEPVARHAQRFAHPFLVVDHELARATHAECAAHGE